MEDGRVASAEPTGGVEGHPARVVFGGGTISPGVARANEPGDGSAILWRGATAGDRGSQGRGNPGGGVQAAEVERGGTEAAAQRGPGEGENGGEAANGNDDDLALDRGTTGDGRGGLRCILSASSDDTKEIFDYAGLTPLEFSNRRISR